MPERQVVVAAVAFLSLHGGGEDRVGKRIWNEAPRTLALVPVSGARSDARRIEPNPTLYLGISRETDVESRVK